MISYYPATKKIVKEIQARIDIGGDLDLAVNQKLSEVDNEFLVDLVRENMSLVECNHIEGVSKNPSILDLIKQHLKIFLTKRIEENSLLRTLTPESQRTEMIHFLACLMDKFPGLVNGDDEVNGGDLTNWISERFDQSPHLKIVRRWPEWEEWYAEFHGRL